MILLAWHEILFSVTVASFIAGLILTILLLILASSTLASQGADSGDAGAEADAEADGLADGDLNAEISTDSEVEIEADADAEVDIEGGSNLDLTSDEVGGIEEAEASADANAEADLSGTLEAGAADTDDIISMENQTPLSLVASLYMLWFGAIGVVLYSRMADKQIWLMIILIVPIGITKGISLIWRRLSRNTAYKVRTGYELIGKPARIKIEVSSESGTISIHAGDSVQQMPAKALHPYATFYEGETVFICGFEGGIYLVDSNPESIKHARAKPSNKKPKSISQFHQATIRPDA
jgi:membrane protein implicated in regulation of membrane protease activity